MKGWIAFWCFLAAASSIVSCQVNTDILKELRNGKTASTGR